MLRSRLPIAWTPKKTAEEIEKYFQEQQGKLRGKIVLLEKPKDVTPVTTAPAARYSDADLAKEAEAPTPQVLPQFDLEKMILPEKREERRALFDLLPLDIQAKIWEHADDAVTDKVNHFLAQEGAVAVIVPSYNADARNGFWRGRRYVQGRPAHGLAAHCPHGGALQSHRAIARQESPREDRVGGALDRRRRHRRRANIIANIPGASKPDEVVMIGAHFDSWIGGTGATDNGTGSSVMIESCAF